MASSAKGFMDKSPLDFECRHEGCKRKIKTTVGALRRNPSLRCSAGHTTKVDARDFDKGVRQMEERVDDIFRKYK
jgi:hypothetical protein